MHRRSCAVAIHPPTRRSRHGFTLIDVIVILVILGILAAFAIPRFAGVNAEARRTAIRGLAEGLRGTSARVHDLAMARGLTAASGQTVQFEGAVVKLVHAYPEASNEGIGNSAVNLDGFDGTVDSAAGTVTYVPRNAPAAPATCSVVYTQASVRASAAVKLNDGDCS